MTNENVAVQNNTQEVAGSGEITSPLSESITSEFDGLLNTISEDMGKRKRVRQCVLNLRKAWLQPDESASRLLKNPTLETLRNLYPQSEGLIARLSTDLGRRRAVTATQLDEAIHSFCTETDQPCQGRYPRLTIAHFIEVSVDEQTRRTKVGTLSLNSVDWTKIRPTLEREIARVWKRPFDAAAFRDELLDLYGHLNARIQSPTGFLRLVDLYKDIRSARAARPSTSEKRLSAYYRDEFCADLSTLWRSQVSNQLPGPQLEFTSIRSAQDGFPVILPNGDVATWGFVKPKR